MGVGARIFPIVGAPDLIVLDVPAGPDERPISKRTPITPIVKTMGGQCNEVDRIIALKFGADDCLSQPYRMPESLARIRAILRRKESAARRSEYYAARRVCLRANSVCGAG